MNAAVLVELGKPLTITNVKLPNHLDVGQVLVKIRYSGICGSQLGEIDGAKGEDKYLPHLLGHEGSGVVIECGAGVRMVAPGDNVVLHWRKGPGIESLAPVYEWNNAKLNAGWVTTFNEYAVVSENRLTKLPADCDMQVAALFGCAVTTGFGVVQNNARIQIGESVVVYGAGGVGLNMVQAAVLAGAYPVIAVDIHESRLELAKALGATHLVNARTQEAMAAIRSFLGGVNLDVFIDNTGNPQVIEGGYRITSSSGRVILVGVPRKGNDISIHSLPLHFGKVLTGSHGGEARPEQDIPRYQRLFSAGKLKLKQLITDVRPLPEINKAIEGMRTGSVSGRCLISFTD
jgi:S-(hydroxymethyl)glutathione dehydrogenase/alcohol dehydrogenase